MNRHKVFCERCKKYFTCSNHCEKYLSVCLCYECDVKANVSKGWLKKCDKHFTNKEQVVFT